MKKFYLLLVMSFMVCAGLVAQTAVDIGKDYAGDEADDTIQSESGVNFESGKMEYTLNEDSSNEVKFIIGGTAEYGGSDNRSTYKNPTSSNTPFLKVYTPINASYVEISATNKLISTLKMNGTTASITDGTFVAALFCDQAVFDGNSVIGYASIDVAACRAGNAGHEITDVPAGTRSVRIYNYAGLTETSPGKYSISDEGEITVGEGKQQYRVTYAKVVLTGGGDIADKNNNILSAKINGKVATVSKDDATIKAGFRRGTTLGNWPVEFTLASDKATADFTSGSNHNFANGPLTIKVTAESGDVKTYTVSATVRESTTVGILTANGKKEAYDDLLISAFDKYDIEYITAATSAPADIAAFYDEYDLIVVHANVSGNNATLAKTRELVGVMPILNLKVYCYNDGRWSWSASGSNPANAGIGEISANVATALQNHNIFEGVTFEGESLTFYSEPTNAQNGIQYATSFGGTTWTEELENANHILATFGEGTQMHEVNLNNAAKYLMIGISQEGSPSSFELFNTNTVTILKNAAAYLLNPDAYYDYATNKAITSIEKPTVNSNLSFREGRIINPENEVVRIFNLSGINLLTSSDKSIDLSGLSSGIFIAVSQNGALKFVK